MTIPRKVLQFPKQPRKADCQGEIHRVSLRSPVMNNLLRSLGVDPVQWWIEKGTEMVNRGLKDIEANAGRAHVREMLLLKLEEFKT
jgi:hypothetical protein